MSDFEYSIEALNARNRFLQVEAIIYVEGDDDVPFWYEIFSKIPHFNFTIEPRGGAIELDKYIALIEDGYLNAIAARDSDYLFFTGKASKCAKVVYTLGYSIENTLYTVDSVHALTKSWCKTPTLNTNICDDWFREFSLSFESLLVQDVANSQAGTGLQVLYDNCSQFMSGKFSSTPCKNKVAAKFNEIQRKLPLEILKEVEAKFDKNADRIALSIRGHFLASAISRFITRQAQALNKKISLSSDGLYTSAITYLGGNFRDNHPHYQHYTTSVLAARNALKS
ncbi:MAG: DUF4435 domain-containing protein [Candidatus Saccharibacteria bacterium]|nr:DUF4435 domain-containing protein [Moraxellaceae bacterium]